MTRQQGLAPQVPPKCPPSCRRAPRKYPASTPQVVVRLSGKREGQTRKRGSR